MGSANATHGLARHESLMAHAVADEIGDGDELEVVLAAEDGEIGEARHGAIVIHDFANDAARGEAR